jgi:hypothetical protein
LEENVWWEKKWREWCVSKRLLRMAFKTQLFINGEFRGLHCPVMSRDIAISYFLLDAIRGGTFNTINPANGEIITAVSAATAEDIDGPR